jgi:dienelactone hydrolase
MWGPQSAAVLVTGIALALAAVAGALVGWSRVRGPAGVRVLQRVGLVLLCQVTAIAVVGVALNRLDGFFATWTDVAGILRDVGGTVPSVPASPQVHAAGAVAVRPADQASHGPFTWSGGLWRAHAHGDASGITGDVLVWTPPGYDPRRPGGYRVLLALSGYPGTPVTTINGLDLPAAVTSRAADGRLPATIVVTASTNIDGQNWDCADVPGGPRVATWLTRDVATLVGRSFDVAPGRWTTIGVSTGAYCAVRLAATDPAHVGAAIALGGDAAADCPALNQGRGAHANDLRTLVAGGADPPVSLFVAASRQDGTTAADAEALRAAAGRGVTATVRVQDVGGHVWPVWAGMAAGGLDWLGAHEPS